MVHNPVWLCVCVCMNVCAMGVGGGLINVCENWIGGVCWRQFFFSRRLGWVMGRQFLCHVFIGFQYVFCPVTERTKCTPSTTCLKRICIINLYTYSALWLCIKSPGRKKNSSINPALDILNLCITYLK